MSLQEPFVPIDCDVLIIGGGASGLMCAIEAGKRGRRVIVLDRSNRVGKKILMSGGGRCNFMNLNVEPANFLSSNPHFCISALRRYTQWDFLALVDKHRIRWQERKLGQLFCEDSAKDILDMLLAECAAAGVSICTRCEISDVNTTADAAGKPACPRFTLTTNQGEFRTESLVVATGGLSIPSMGASGFGYELARQFGHTVLPTRAGLVPFVFSDGFRDISERLSGVAQDACVSNTDASFTESILFTHRGLSGPAVLQISSYWQPGESVFVNLLPGVNVPALLRERKTVQPRSLLRTVLSESMAKKLVEELQALLWPAHAETAMAEIPDAVLQQVAEGISNWTLRPASTEGYRTAEVTLGGVDTNELSSRTMESKKQPGLYFIGEVVDVTGHLGGFNFQWAWSSGWAAGQVV